jgi:hypothetical protein
MKREADIITSYATSELGMGMYTGGRTTPTHDEIAQLAFSFYESRGRHEGHALEDWLRTEQGLVHHYA